MNDEKKMFELLMTIIDKMDQFEQRQIRMELKMDNFELRMDRLEQKVDKLEQDVSELKQRMDKLEQKVDKLEQKIDKLEQEVSDLKKNLVSMDETNRRVYRGLFSAYEDLNEVSNEIHLRLAEVEKIKRKEEIRELREEFNLQDTELQKKSS